MPFSPYYLCWLDGPGLLAAGSAVNEARHQRLDPDFAYERTRLFISELTVQFKLFYQQ